MAKGSIRERGKGKYQLEYIVGYDNKGNKKRRYRTVVAKNKTEANKLLAQFITEIETGTYFKENKITFSHFAKRWREKYAKKHLEINTIINYDSFLNQYIIPVFGHVPLEKINHLQIMDFMDKLIDKKLENSTINKIIQKLKTMLDLAVDWKLIKESPAKNIKNLKEEKEEVEVYTNEEVKRLFRALDDEQPKYRVLIKLAIATGMRRGELLALKWNNVNLEKGTIQVKETVIHHNKKFIFKEPKTKSSIRTISLPQFMIDELNEYKLYCKKVRLQAGENYLNPYNLLFHTYRGNPIIGSTITRKWASITKNAKLTHIKFHALRHTSATMLINKGLPSKIISSRLGHSNVMTTQNIYAHALREADEVAAQKIDDIFNNKEVK